MHTTRRQDPDTYRRYLKYRAEGMSAAEAARCAIAERPTPAEMAIAELQKAFDLFNAELFDGQLPPTMLTMQRITNGAGTVFGYYRPQGFRNNRNIRTVDEISVNPAALAGYPTIENLQTMVHEQCHQWQHRRGKPSRKSYHNREFAEKMKSVGLMPSSTGKPGGAETGQTMADYPIPGGKFLAACEKLLAAGFLFTWGTSDAPILMPMIAAIGAGGDLPTQKPASGTKAGKKTKFVCPKCQAKAWGKDSLNLICGDCGVKMEADEPITAPARTINTATLAKTA